MGNKNSRISDLILRALDHLSQEDFKRFKDKLSYSDFNGKGFVPKSQLENADRVDTKNFLIKCCGGDDAIDTTIQILTEINQKGSAAKLREEREKDYRMKYREYVWEEYQVIQDKNARLGEWVNLSRRYTQLLIIQKHRLLAEKEHEIMSTGKKHANIMAKQASPCWIGNLFDPDDSRENPRTVVLQGPAGIGKTMTARKIMLDWAVGKLYQGKFDYAFYINCREMNLVTKQQSLADLIFGNCPERNAPINDIFANSEKLLFIIDGLDEFKFSLEQKGEYLSIDPSQKKPVEVLLNSLVRKNILPKSYLIITTRPIALEQLQEYLKYPRYVEILGFSEKDREEYFHKFFGRKWQAVQAFGFVKANEMLFTMCFVPIVCWIICTVMKQQLDRGEDLAHMSKTTTSVYMFYLTSLLRDHNTVSESGKNFHQLCLLAREGVLARRILFEEDDLQKYGLTETDIQSLFLHKSLFQQDIDCQSAYSFIHLTFQEFFAALSYVLEERLENTQESVSHHEDVRKLLKDFGEGGKEYLMLTVRFLFGLLNEERKKSIEKILSCKIGSTAKQVLLEWVEAEIASKNFQKHLEIFCCLYEIQEEEFVGRAMDHFQEIKLYDSCLVNTFNSLVISFCLRHCRREQSLHLGYLLFLSRFKRCNLRDTSLEILASVLTINQHLREFNLLYSDLGEEGVTKLCQALIHPNCKLQILRLRCCNLRSKSCEKIASVVPLNQSLRELHLDHNDIGDAGVAKLCQMLVHPECKLQVLSLNSCSITAVCCADLASVLCSNQTLAELSLAQNDRMGEAGVQLLCESLLHPNCKLETLRLDSCELTEASWEYLCAALRTNQSLRELDLYNNEDLKRYVKAEKYSRIKEVKQQNHRIQICL
ncbi:NACHT, LRR and PYD domains-containing protein 6 [Eublepharis macularius]|uniref:NACHT, LRR and PYD domains-containing protein 3 n=1 Tax=Eublepharis macularius TaxID=481883 RepID=A0AA97KN14_EUBMA|nr:NACHT, LRR and PYD domains-containing protein 6 [Eublepharis macularius]